jgi:chromosome segregation ATPase
MQNLCDPLIRRDAIDKLVNSPEPNLEEYKNSIRNSQETYEATMAHLQQEASKKGFVDKKFEENRQFLASIDADIAESFLTLHILERQHELKTETTEEMEKLIEKMVEQQEGIKEANTEMLTQAQKEGLIRLVAEALKTAQQKVEAEIQKIDVKIAEAIHDWGGATWKIGLEKQAVKLVNEFGNEFKNAIDFSHKSASEQTAIEQVMQKHQTVLTTRLNAMVDPETRQEKLREPYEKAMKAAEAAPDALLGAPPAADPSLPLKEIPPPKSHIIIDTLLEAKQHCMSFARDCQAELLKLFPHDERLKHDINEFVKHSMSQGSLHQFGKKLFNFGGLCDLGNIKSELQSTSKNLLMLAETKILDRIAPRMGN